MTLTKGHGGPQEFDWEDDGTGTSPLTHWRGVMKWQCCRRNQHERCRREENGQENSSSSASAGRCDPGVYTVISKLRAKAKAKKGTAAPPRKERSEL